MLDILLKKGGGARFEYERRHPEQRQLKREHTGWDIVIKPRQAGFSTLELTLPTGRSASLGWLPRVRSAVLA